MNTHESYVSLETAKLLKEAGFDWKCSGHWVETNKNNETALLALSPEPCLYDLSIVDVGNSSFGCMCTIQDWNVAKDENGFQFYYSAPTLEVAQRWLREVEGWILETHYFGEEFFGDDEVDIESDLLRKYPNKSFYMCYGYFENCMYIEEDGNTYEDSLEAGIKKALEIILEKGE